MMRHILAFFLTTTTMLAIAQSFQSSNCFQVGTEGTVNWAFSTSLYADALQNTGFNYQWDFTNYAWTTPTGAYTFTDGSSSGNATFSGSDLREYGLTTFTRELFYSYSENQDTLYYDGLASGSNYAYYPSIPYLTFPLQPMDSSYHHQSLYVMTGQGPTITGSATRTWKYDGYGTVVLPYGTQNNCFRIKTTQTDSTYITNFNVTYEEIIWFRATDGLPVLRFQNQGGYISCYYASVDNITNVSSEQSEEKLLFPNPATDIVRFSWPYAGRIDVFDLSGRYVSCAYAAQGAVSLGELASGIYMIAIPERKEKMRIVLN
jgi:hypothetical protein